MSQLLFAPSPQVSSAQMTKSRVSQDILDSIFAQCYLLTDVICVVIDNCSLLSCCHIDTSQK